MRRAEAIWIVQGVRGAVFGAFTVKRELAEWIERRGVPLEQDDLSVVRIGDGGYFPDAVPIAVDPVTLEMVKA